MEYCFLHTGKGDMNDWHCFQEIKRHKRPTLFLMHLHWCAQFFWKQWEQSDNTAFKGLKWHKRPTLFLMYLHWCCLPLLKAMVIIRRNWLTTNKTNQTRWLMTSEFGSSWWGIKRVWLITSEFVCLDRITSSSVSCWEQQSLTRKIFGLVDVEEASPTRRVTKSVLQYQ